MKLLALVVALSLIAGELGASNADNGLPSSPPQRETYSQAAIDSSGALRITTSDGRSVVVPKEGEQRSLGEPIMSVDRTAVGSQAYYENCCTSYDIPLQLIVYSNGKVHRFTGSGLPIFRWHFADAGTRVAYGQETVHFACEVHYELRDIESERLIDSADVPQPCGLRPDPPAVAIPKWVEALRAERR